MENELLNANAMDEGLFSVTGVTSTPNKVYLQSPAPPNPNKVSKPTDTSKPVPSDTPNSPKPADTEKPADTKKTETKKDDDKIMGMSKPVFFIGLAVVLVGGYFAYKKFKK